MVLQVSIGRSGDLYPYVTDYLATPWCTCCGGFDPEYKWTPEYELLTLRCSRCGFIWGMRPKWTLDSDEVVY